MRGRLTIEGAATEVGGARIEGPTKTGKKRTVVLPAFISEAIVRHLAAFGAPLDPESLIFTTDLGGPVRQANFRNREWMPALEELGWGEYVRENGRRHFVPRYRIHDLRHTATSLAILAGAQPKVIQEMGGWSSIDIVMNRYGHLFDTLQDDLAARQEEAYRAGDGVG
jgi:integrase